MPPRPGTATVESQDMLFAESSLLGERFISLIRIGMIFGYAASQIGSALLEGHAPKLDGVMGATLAMYTAFSVAFAILLRLQVPNPRRAMLAPILVTLVDFAFAGVMGVRNDLMEGRPHAEMAAAGCALLLCYSVARFHWAHVALATSLACVTFTAIGALGAGVRLAPACFIIASYVALGLLIAWTNVRTRRMFVSLRRRENLSRFLPRAVVDRVLSGDVNALAPVHREITMLFSDIRDFTAQSELLPPGEVLQFLDGYLARMTGIVRASGGVVLKYLGDGFLAAWGVPDADADHAGRALAAALELRAALASINETRAKDGQEPLRIGVGIHSGPVAAGMLGGPDQSEYTVIGDSVNLTARVEALTKVHGVDILATDSTWKLAGARFRGKRLGEEAVRGRRESVVLWTVE